MTIPIINSLVDAFSFPFFLRAFFVGNLLAIVFGLVGVLVVLRREANVSHALSGFALVGVALGWCIGLASVLPTMALSVAIGIGLILLLRHTRILSDDSLFESLGHISLAISIVLVSTIHGYRPDLNAYLFGDILAISSTDSILTLVITIIIILVSIRFGRWFLRATLSRDLARTVGGRVNTEEILFLVIVGIVMVASMRILGVLLASAILILPANIAKLLGYSFRSSLILSVIISLVGTSLGLILSYLADFPSGATIVVLLGVMLVFASIYRSIFST